MKANITFDIEYIKSILPSHYEVEESKSIGSVHCKSKIGIRHKIDADDNEHWEYVIGALKYHFGERLQEIDHNVNFCHTDFTIFLKS